MRGLRNPAEARMAGLPTTTISCFLPHPAPGRAAGMKETQHHERAAAVWPATGREHGTHTRQEGSKPCCAYDGCAARDA